ncbi:ATP-binding protein [Roseivirga sp. BDSF3-8]|uniref:ATP-binding protein n=1 Tax=Roseivirga sp. BDSF3-8 TaxID=3241598 RepID=UPI003531A711
MLSLFSDNPAKAGYRLHTFEVYNWGGFDGNIYRITPGGETTLLTGANASGKTTLVDGLLTLLVPQKSARFFNQTAGTKKTERTEESYVLGEFGNTESEEGTEVQRLRPDKAKTHSILLATFKSEERFVTLAQVRWFSGSEMKRSFIIAHKELSIEKDFLPLDSSNLWKKRLKNSYPKEAGREMLRVMDRPGEYATHMRDIFGMRSEKAHDLFNQTIGLKVLGSLDLFIRTHMLEPKDSEGEFRRITGHFQKLSRAHKAILKAHKQIELLRPVQQKHSDILKVRADIEALEADRDLALWWFTNRHVTLLEEYLKQKNDEYKALEEEQGRLTDTKDELSEQRSSLEADIKTNKEERYIKDLEEANKRLNQQKVIAEDKLKQYQRHARHLDGIGTPNEAQFDEQRQQGSKALAEVSEKLEDTYEKRLKADRELIDQQEAYKEMAGKLSILRQQKNNITGRVSEIRQELLQHTGATEEEIPFIGELMRVKETEGRWESAIERLLHNFALRLIVPDRYYTEVNEYVNTHNLRGRIVYQRYKEEERLSFDALPEANRLYHKLDFKSSAYETWLEQEIQHRFDYVCTDDLQEFGRVKMALTSEGLIKNVGRHEKDDRAKVKSRQHYVLGWDNKEKIAALREEMLSLEDQIKHSEQKLDTLSHDKKSLEQRKESWNELLRFKSYHEINWAQYELEKRKNNEEIERLRATNDKVREMKRQVDELKARIKEIEEKINETNRRSGRLETDIENKRQALRGSRSHLETIAHTPAEGNITAFEEKHPDLKDLALEGLESRRGILQGKLIRELTKLTNALSSLTNSMAAAMRKFKNPDQEVTKLFADWNTDTHLLGEEPEYVGDYLDLLEKIESEELAKYREDFEKYLNNEMITQMTSFSSWLNQQEDGIRNNIDELNKSLKAIPFKANPATYIQLRVDNDYTKDIKDLKFKLQDWKPDVGHYERTQDENILEEAFNKIRSLLDELEENEANREKLLDVRNWLKFIAVEHYKEDHKTFRTYTGTEKLSGGESAQLTYTILGSAIAYQFGLHSSSGGLNTDSFRFICVDEAFSKQDDEKAKYLMDLVKQLNLQLMVVSPAKSEEVAIVEPYISHVHYVQRRNNRDSIVHNMSILEYQQQRDAYRAEQEEVAS